jgi:hypothetical protein
MVRGDALWHAPEGASLLLEDQGVPGAHVVEKRSSTAPCDEKNETCATPGRK